MSQLSGLLTMVPLTITPEVVREFLSKRKQYRLEGTSKAGSSANPDLVAPMNGEWTGTCKECRAALDGQEITYRLSFKPCGTLEGIGNSPVGKFVIKGVYNMQKGTVAWRQSSPHAPSSCEYGSKMIAEFVGDLTLAHWPSQPGSIVGTWLTTSGEFYEVKLRDPQATFHPHLQTVPLPLPTLLTGGCTPRGAATPQFYSKKEQCQLPEDNKAPVEKTRGFALQDWITSQKELSSGGTHACSEFVSNASHKATHCNHHQSGIQRYQ